jgi:hypothetical protein
MLYEMRALDVNFEVGQLVSPLSQIPEIQEMIPEYLRRREDAAF